MRKKNFKCIISRKALEHINEQAKELGKTPGEFIEFLIEWNISDGYVQDRKIEIESLYQDISEIKEMITNLK